MGTETLNPSLLTSFTPPLAHVHYKIGRIIFTCVSSWCEGSAGSQVSLVPLLLHWSVLMVVCSLTGSGQCYTQAQFNLCSWGFESSKGCTLYEQLLKLRWWNMCCWWEDDCVWVGNVLSELLTFLPAQHFFPLLLFLSPLFLWTLKSLVLRVKLLSPHPNYTFSVERRKCSLPIILRDGFSLWHTSPHRPWGAFISTSGEVNRVCPQTNTPYFLLQPLDMFVVFPLRLSVIQLADVNTVHCDNTWKSRQQFKLTNYLEVETHPKVLVNLFKVQLQPLHS